MSSSKRAVRGRVEEARGLSVVVRSVSTMAEGRVGVSSRGGGTWMCGTVALGVASFEPSAAGAGDGEEGVLGTSSRGETGEKLGKETRDLSDSAIEVAELEGCDVSLPLLLLVARTVADL